MGEWTFLPTNFFKYNFSVHKVMVLKFQTTVLKKRIFFIKFEIDTILYRVLNFRSIFLFSKSHKTMALVDNIADKAFFLDKIKTVGNIVH